ncbi:MULTISPECIES: ketopantoate reductase family protein [Paenibacillus]|uniref:ketopantoate reductase family protein n=1 Tax=Paenibacillus TaxID=44249 RepID=UPI002FE0CF49
MRILVLGAGGVGGYFGGRLAEKGADVTFLVRSRRKQQLERDGLVVRSVHGDVTIRPKTITAENHTNAPYDLVLFSSKAYHLEEAVRDLKPYVGERTVVLPLLNGVAHYPLLQREFGADRVIGGLCFIETILNQEGHVLQTSKDHFVRFGEFGQAQTERIREIEQALGGTKSSFLLSDHIERDIWHKYLFIAAIAGVTTLMRAPVGPIRETAGGADFVRGVFRETEAIMLAHGAPLDKDIVERHMETTHRMSFEMKSSMLRDMEKGYAVEGEHLHGYLLGLAEQHGLEAPRLQAIYHNLRVYGRENS